MGVTMHHMNLPERPAVTIGKGLRSKLLAVVAAFGCAILSQRAGAVPITAFSNDRIELLVSGAVVTPLFTSTTDSAHLVQGGVDFGNSQNSAPLDALQAASGPAKPPPQNTFTPIGANAGLARSDVLITPFGAIDKQNAVGRNVAETYLAKPGSGAGSAEDKIDFRVTQNTTTAIRFLLLATPGILVQTTAAGDSSTARIAASLEIFDPTGAKKALWLPCGSTGPAATNNCAVPGNGMTIDAGFAGTLSALLDPFSLNMSETCVNANCKMVYQPGAGPANMGAFLLTANVGMGSNVFVEFDMFEADLVSGTQQMAAVGEPGSLWLLACGLFGLAMIVRRKPSRGEYPL
jgi:hypothetical protein